RQRRVAPALVEALQERVFLRVLEHHLAVEALRQPYGEARLADADRPLHDDEPRRVAGLLRCLLRHAPLPMPSILGSVQLTAPARRGRGRFPKAATIQNFAPPRADAAG